ncbi:ankyrin repeat and SOCS box protein 7-like [Patiria miniata]|uniref:SOCS box domain-containing protein n=1 Tax=Patiria miniata TaxID=46514 RepID=A0A914BPT2_PATMI|nr:ankyrin repeat and SOCS box protein 7-like [Patiria miniata]XP_038078284.1 ankyrin repeat and SOCS box protein 7-like [Patiria miniata]
MENRMVTRKQSRHQITMSVLDKDVRKAVALGDVAKVRQALEAGISPNDVDNNGWTLLHLAASRGRDRVLRLLLEEGGKPEIRDIIGGFTCLHYAAMHGRTRLARLLLEYDKSKRCELVDIPSRDGWTPLHVAAHYGRDSFVRLLVMYSATVDPLSVKGTTPLQLAIIREKQSCVKVLLDNQANIDIQRGFPLRYTIIKGNHDAARLLLNRGANPNLSREDDGQTPLHLAAIKNDNLNCRLLYSFGASCHACGDDGKTPLDTYKDVYTNKESAPCFKFLQGATSNPRKLQDTCRLTIRHAIGKTRLHLIDNLPLSILMTNYLRYKYDDFCGL